MCSSPDRDQRRSSPRRCRTRTTSPDWYPRSRSSARASRRRNRRSRTAPATGPSCRAHPPDGPGADVRWAACRRRRERGETCRSIRKPRTEEIVWWKHDVLEATGEHQRIEQDEPVGTDLIELPREIEREQPAQHVAAVERRNRDHVEHGEQEVQLHSGAEYPR